MPVEDDVPWLDAIRDRETALPEGAPQLGEPLVDASGAAATTRDGWLARRSEIRRRWRTFLGTVAPDRGPPEFRTVEEERVGEVVRRLVTYETEPGRRARGYLLLPVDAEGTPGVAVFHSTTDHTIDEPAGLAEDRERLAFGLRLARRGFVTFCPECFLWRGDPEADGAAKVRAFRERWRGVTGMAKMLSDARRAVDVLQGVEQVASDRIGAMGHSLGAKEVLYLTAFDDRVRAAVFSEGGIGIDDSNWDAPWYLGDGIHDFGRRHHEVLSLVPPRPFLLIGGEGADGAGSWPYVEAVQPIYDLYDVPRRMGVLNHGEGHSFPRDAEERAVEWLRTYLDAG